MAIEAGKLTSCAFPKGRGTVYFIEAVGANRIKIGWTSAPSARARLMSLQTCSPFELGILLEIPGSCGDERELHRHFHALRVSTTTEWFHAKDDLWVFLSEAYDAMFCDGRPLHRSCHTSALRVNPVRAPSTTIDKVNPRHPSSIVNVAVKT